jgi:drug/metabolite transporter (DMT)-like permease
VRRGQWTPIVISGALLFLQIVTFNLGTERSTASHGTLFINTFIFWVAAIEHFITGDHRLTLRQLLGLLVAAAGVVVLVTGTELGAASPAAPPHRDAATLSGDLLLLVSGFLLGLKVVYTRYAVRRVAPGTLTLWHAVVAVALFALYTAAFETVDLAAFDRPAVLSLLYLGPVISGFCFASQAWLLRRHSASLISVFSFVTPVCGVFLAVLLRGDELSQWLIVAGAAVAAGIWLVTVMPRRAEHRQTV